MTVADNESSGRSAEEIASLIKTLSHPVRTQALRELAEKTWSPTELAILLDCPLSYTSYHVRVLLDAKTVEEVRTAPRGGATEHFYRATELGNQLLEMLDS